MRVSANPILSITMQRHPELVPAYDAFEDQDARAPSMIVGLPAMMCFPSNVRPYQTCMFPARVTEATFECIVLTNGLVLFRFYPRENGWFTTANAVHAVVGAVSQDDVRDLKRRVDRH